MENKRPTLAWFTCWVNSEPTYNHPFWRVLQVLRWNIWKTWAVHVGTQSPSPTMGQTMILEWPNQKHQWLNNSTCKKFKAQKLAIPFYRKENLSPIRQTYIEQTRQQETGSCYNPSTKYVAMVDCEMHILPMYVMTDEALTMIDDCPRKVLIGIAKKLRWQFYESKCSRIKKIGWKGEAN